MPRDAPEAQAGEPSVAGNALRPTPELGPARRAAIYGYLGALLLLLPLTGISGITTSIVLKDRLHLGPDAVAGFWFFVSVPGYVGFLFGLARDHWSPFGLKDRGLLILFAGLSALAAFGMAAAPAVFGALFLLTLLRAISGGFMGAAQQGLTATLGQGHSMSGRLSTLWQTLAWLPMSTVIGGRLAERAAPSLTFALSGLVAIAILAFALWRPAAIYADPAEAQALVRENLAHSVARLAWAPGILPVLLLLFLWSFTPGVGTPILYYLTDTLHGTAAQYGDFQSLFSFCFLPTFLLHGILCTRFRLRPLLWISTCIGVPQIMPLLMVHSSASAMWAGVPMGLMGGFATAAYFDLLIRTCPAGLQGTAMMLGAGVWGLSAEIGNVVGSHLYKLGGFPICAYATLGTYACLLLILPFVPRRLTATRDGEPLPEARPAQS